MSKKVTTIRIPRYLTIIFIVIAVIIFVAFVAFHIYFGERVHSEEMSVSRDGMYKYIQREIYTAMEDPKMRLYVYKCKDPSTAGNPRSCKWELIKEELIQYDSIGGSSSASWEYDNKHRTKTLVVWKHMHSPPTTSLKIPLDSK